VGAKDRAEGRAIDDPETDKRASPAERTQAITTPALSCVYVDEHPKPVGAELFTPVAKSAHCLVAVIDLTTANFPRRCERLDSMPRIATNCRAASGC
jgi:hypothetical protein